MAKNVVNGTDLCLFIGASGATKCIALATSCKIGISMATRQISSKDSTGSWEENVAARLSWTCDSDNLYTADLDSESGATSGYSYSHLADLMIARTPIIITVGEVTTEGMGYEQTLGTGKTLTGSAYITGIDLNAPDQDNSTFTISMIGTGALTHA